MTSSLRLRVDLEDLVRVRDAQAAGSSPPAVGARERSWHCYTAAWPGWAGEARRSRRPSSIEGQTSTRAATLRTPRTSPRDRDSGGREAVQRWRLVVAREPLTGRRRPSASSWRRGKRRSLASGLPVAGLDAPRPRPRLRPRRAARRRHPRRGRARRPLARGAAPALARARGARSRAARRPRAGGPVRRLAGRAAAARVGWSPPSTAPTVCPPAEPPPPGSRSGGAARGRRRCPRERRKGETTVSYDLRPFLAALEVTPRPADGAVRPDDAAPRPRQGHRAARRGAGRARGGARRRAARGRRPSCASGSSWPSRRSRTRRRLAARAASQHRRCVSGRRARARAGPSGR